uniref:Dynein cytoplasmic 1 heavy chain 1 n=1 Tax=Pseudonaja textilis TaxID=8673 RepID=A0A670YY35_PSETE
MLSFSFNIVLVIVIIFIIIIVNKPPVKESISKFMAYVHTSVNEMSYSYLTNERRYNYTTPKSFLEQIKLYQNLLLKKRKELTAKMERLENGLQKLSSTSAQVDDLKAKLAAQEVELKQKNEDADQLIQVVGTETEKVSKEKAIADEEEQKVALITEEVQQKQKDCEKDLAQAEPALAAAQQALNTLNKTNLTELKSFGSPPSAVSNVTAAVMVLMGSGGKVPKDRSWKAAKVAMAKVDSFLDSLIHFNKENIHENSLRALQPYLQDTTFNPELVASKSYAAAGLCSWVINIVRFYNVYCDVEPKRQALNKANAELANAQEKLANIKAKIAVSLNAKKHPRKLSVGGLASENVRWADSVRDFKLQENALCGDVLLITAFVSYLGYFSKKYRQDLMDHEEAVHGWSHSMLLPTTENIHSLTWQNESLPADRMSVENATILTNCERWPLMVDPQLQVMISSFSLLWEFLKVFLNAYHPDAVFLRYLDIVEQALAAGEVVLIENLEESVDPVLGPLLGRETIKKGRFIKIGDKECEYNPSFQLILHTKLANPHYQPEMQAQCTLINFTVTRDGLEDQLLYFCRPQS